MYPLITIAITLAALVTLLHCKVRLGRAMLAAAVLLALLLTATPAELYGALRTEWLQKPLQHRTPVMFITLTALITLVNILGLAMKQTGVAARLPKALMGLFRSRRLALCAIPMMMGMLPTPGGIMLSAPMVRDLGDHLGVKRDRQAAINFLFRHQWETIWPLFPAVPLVQGMLGVSALALITHNLAIMLTGTIAGAVFLLLRAMPQKAPRTQSHDSFWRNLRRFVHAFWPIALVAVLYAALDLTPALGLLVAVVAFLALHRTGVRESLAIFRRGFEPDFILLILGALSFKVILEASGAVPSVVDFLDAMHVPPNALIFILPFLIAFLTGVTTGTIAISFPLIIPFIGTGPQANLHLEVLAFSGVICGLLLTPVHLCLTLSAGYFETSLTKIILQLLTPTLAIAAVAVAIAAVFA